MKHIAQARKGDWSALDAYLRDIHSQPTLTEESLVETAARAAKGDVSAQELLVRSHLRLVSSIAHQYGGYGLPLADIISEGNIGLIRAAELYDPKFGTKFSTYASVWIKQRIHRAITKMARAVRIPVWRSQRLRKVARMNEELSAQLGRPATEGELAERLGLTSEEFAELQGDRLQVSSLDAPLSPNDESTDSAIASMPDESTPDAYSQVNDRELREELISALHDLDDRELEVISAKYGLRSDDSVSFREIGRRFGLSHEWVRRLSELALVKIRRAFEVAGKKSTREHQERRRSVLERIARLGRKAPARCQLATSG
ncbi:MAG: polymerase primary sigma factor [Verrucomicrobiota bacterium]|jgi:RNA polymerase primary sigma factor